MGAYSTLHLTRSKALSYIEENLEEVSGSILDEIVSTLTGRNVDNSQVMSSYDAIVLDSQSKEFIRNQVHIINDMKISDVMDVLLDERLYNCIVVADTNENQDDYI
jgi:hypothetical protein